MRKTCVWPVVALFAALLLAGCGGDDNSRAEFEADVRQTRDRVDSALAYITAARSRPDLLDRMAASAKSIERSADDLDEAGAAEGFEDEADALVKALRQLSVDLAATAAQIRDPAFSDLAFGARGFSFQSWIDANRVLRDLRRQGIDVQPLARH